MRGQGLGLISMRERSSLVKGTVSITSTPMGGTEINVRVPWAPAKEASEITFGAA
jgi:signal transduction histidine kinase